MYEHALKMFSFGEDNEGFCDYFEDYQHLEFTPENPIEKQLPELLEAATDVLGQTPPFSWYWGRDEELKRRYWIPEDDVETRKSILRRAIEITKSLLSLEEAIEGLKKAAFNAGNIEFELRKHIPELTYEEFMAKYGNKQPDKYRLICRYPNLPWKISVGDVVTFDETRQQYVWTSDDDKRHHITFSREEIECFPGFWG